MHIDHAAEHVDSFEVAADLQEVVTFGSRHRSIHECREQETLAPNPGQESSRAGGESGRRTRTIQEQMELIQLAPGFSADRFLRRAGVVARERLFHGSKRRRSGRR